MSIQSADQILVRFQQEKDRLARRIGDTYLGRRRMQEQVDAVHEHVARLGVLLSVGEEAIPLTTKIGTQTNWPQEIVISIWLADARIADFWVAPPTKLRYKLRPYYVCGRSLSSYKRAIRRLTRRIIRKEAWRQLLMRRAEPILAYLREQSDALNGREALTFGIRYVAEMGWAVKKDVLNIELRTDRHKATLTVEGGQFVWEEAGKSAIRIVEPMGVVEQLKRSLIAEQSER